MFNFFKRNKTVNASNVKNFDTAIKAIKRYIELSDWGNAVKALDEIVSKEKKSFENLVTDLERNNPSDSFGIIKREEQKYKEREEKLNKIREILERKKEKYIKAIEKERFEVRFKKIKTEINNLLGKKEFLEAMNLLKKFFEENKNKDIVLNFYNEERKRIQKIIEKQRKYEQNKIKRNTEFEALSLIGEIQGENDKKDTQETSIFSSIKNKFNNFLKLEEEKKNKKLLDKIKILLEEDDIMKQKLAERRLENIHNGLVREINVNQIIGYNLYGKILGANKISGDAFGMEETKNNYVFFIGDATGHGIKAGFIITLLNKLFNINYTKPFKELVYEINNQLKQNLESRNFITGIFFEIDKNTNEVHYIGMGHEAMFIYRKETKTVERIIPGGLAIGIQKIENKDSIRVKELKMKDGDILMSYSDGLLEAKNMDGEFYGINKLEEIFTIATQNGDTNIDKIYNYIINDVKLFRGGTLFDDDLTIILLKRKEENDLVRKGDDYSKELQAKQGLDKNDLKEIEGKTRKEALKKAEEIKKKKETKLIVESLKNLYYTGEMLQLKEEAARHIKEGYIDKNINFYLKKAMENEAKYRISLKEQKMQSKYNVLNTLYNKGDYQTVINEIEDLISKDGNI